MPRGRVEWQGRSWTLAELARQHGIDRRTLQCRLDAGEPLEEALQRRARPYPRVQRRRARRPPEPEPVAPEGPCCARCGGTAWLLPFIALQLCRRCRQEALALVGRWVRVGAVQTSARPGAP